MTQLAMEENVAMAKKMEDLEGRLKELEKEKEERKKLVDGKMAQMDKQVKTQAKKLEEMDALKGRLAALEKKAGIVSSAKKPAEKVIKRECVDDQQQQEAVRSGKALKRRGAGQEEEEQNMAKQQKIQGGKEEEQIAEYARVIAVPTVTNLQKNYNRGMLLQLIQNGNDITKSIYIQRNQWFSDYRIVQSIVDLLARTEKPEKMIGEVKIENFMVWPRNGQLQLKERKSNVAYTFNEASARPDKFSYRYSAEYELANKNSRFQVLIYYAEEDRFNKWVEKFVYRRLA